MPASRPDLAADPAPRDLRRLAPEAAGLLLVLALVVLSWQLVHGLTRGLYDAYEVQGTPPAAASPVGETGRSQLGPWGYFWSERAFHYRTTLMFAVDDADPPAVLARDTAQQHPEGVDAWGEYALLMEPVYGWLYRVAGQPGEILAEFLTRLVPLIHVLMFVPLYLLARAVGVRPLPAAAAVLVVATCTLGFSRLAGSLLLKENFTLTWLVTLAAAHAWAVRLRRLPLLLLAAACLVVVLVSWHLGSFLALVLLVAAAVAHVSGRDPDDRWSVWLPAAYLAAAVVAGLTPSLWERRFLLGLPVMVLVAWTAVAWLRWRRPRLARRPAPALVLLLGGMVLLGLLSLANRQFTGDYGHVFGLAVQKLAHGFTRPADPAALPFDVRVFWAAPFTSPTLADAWRELGWHVVSLAAALAVGTVLLLRGRLPREQRTLVLVTLALTVGWLLVERLGLVLLPFAAVLLAVVAQHAARAWRPRAPVLAGAAATLLVGATAVANLAGPMADHVRRAADARAGRPVFTAASDDARNWFRGDLLRWLLRETPGRGHHAGAGPAAAVVASIDASPAILLYTGRPVVLNSQFENRPIRRRYQRYLEALFSRDPADLQRFLAEHQARYLVIGRDQALAHGPGTIAYQAGVAGPVTLDRTIARLHFRPQALDFLQPVWDNEFYRVFRVGPPPSEPVTWDRKHGAWWDLASFTVEGQRLVAVDADRRRLQAREQDLQALQRAQAHLLRRTAPAGQGRAGSLRGLHQQYVEVQMARLDRGEPRDPELERRREQLVQAIGRRLAAPDPRTGRTTRQALAALYTAGPPGGGPSWQELLRDDRAEPGHLAAGADLLALLGQYDEAADLMTRAIARVPARPRLTGTGEVRPVAPPLARRLWRTAVWLSLGAGRLEPARDLAATAAPLSAPRSQAARFFRHVAALGR